MFAVLLAAGTLFFRICRSAFLLARLIVGCVIWTLRTSGRERLAVLSPRVRRLGAAAVIVALLGPGMPLRQLVPSPVGSSDVMRRAQVAAAVPAAADSSVGRSVSARSGSRGSTPPIGYVPSSKRTALIIGINRAAGSRPLEGSITDAKHMRDALYRYGFKAPNVRMLTEGAATRAAILAEIRSLAARTESSGLAVFAVATHTRRRGGINHLVAADGNLISATTLASHLGAVRAPMWVALPTCYAGGYALRGIVGPRRIATFASSADQPTYQLGNAGSYLFINMIREGMLAGHAPRSVESAFGYAKRTLEENSPNRVPWMSDGIPGEFVLGPSTWAREVRRRAGDNPENADGAEVHPPVTGDSESYAPEPSPSPTSPPRRKGSVGVCGRLQYNCKRD